MEETIQIRRKYSPGKKNKDGYEYSISSYNNAIEKIRDKIKNGELESELVVGLTREQYIDMLTDPNHGMRNIDKTNTCATIVGITDNFIEVCINDDKNIHKLFSIYKDLKIEPVACMRYLAEKSIFMNNKKNQLCNIITFDIVFPNVSKCNASVILNRTIKSLHKKYKGVCRYEDFYIFDATD